MKGGPKRNEIKERAPAVSIAPKKKSLHELVLAILELLYDTSCVVFARCSH
jgi:hypothetical protein